MNPIPDTRPVLDPEQLGFATSPAELIALSSPPGSGKTEALAGRFMNAVHQGCPPENILVLTFTNRARESFENRLLLYYPALKSVIRNPEERPFADPTDPNRLWIGTFHDTCLRILKYHTAQAGFAQPPMVVDNDIRYERLRSIAANMGILLKDPEEKARQLLDCSRILETLFTLGLDPTFPPPDQYITDNNWVLKRYGRNSPGLYSRYLEKLNLDSAIDLSDIPRQTQMLFDNSMDIKAAWGTRFQHVLVDEYQDTTPLQSSLLMVLGRNASIAACGDPDQSIFGFAGAAGSFDELENLRAKKGEIEYHFLKQDYRLTQQIQESANLLRQKMKKPGQAPITPSPRTGEPPLHIVVRTENELPVQMATDIRSIIENAHEATGYQDFLITARSNKACVDIGQKLQQEGIPVWIQSNSVNGTLQKALRNWLAFAASPEDPWILVQTLCNPPSNVSREILDHPRVQASLEGIPLLDVLERNMEILAGFHKDDFQKMISPYLKVKQTGWALDQGQITPEVYIARILEQSGLSHMANDLDAPRKKAFLDYAEQLKTACRIALSRDEISALASGMDKAGQNPVPHMVEVRNMHQVKGLQWRYVLAVDWVAGKFPMRDNAKSREEDRKLALTAITRASHRFLSYSCEKFRGRAERVSAFIHEAGIEVKKIS